MSQIENSGYKGEALRQLKLADCDIGDIIRVTSKSKVYEGILIPRAELGEGTIVVLRLPFAVVGADGTRLQSARILPFRAA